MSRVKLLPRRLRTPERIYEELVVPYYPTVEDQKWAAERLEIRAWGRPKQEVVVDEGQTQDFTFIFRRWAPGVDPLANSERLIDPRALPPSDDGSGAKWRSP